MSKLDTEFKKILATEWSYSFEKVIRERIKDAIFDEYFIQYCKKAMILSYYKYGTVRRNHGSDNTMDAIANAWKRLNKYYTTRNTEWLCDVFNFVMIEYMSPQAVTSSRESNEILYQATEDNIKVMVQSLEEYERTRDKDNLYTIAIASMNEYIEPECTDTYFKRTDSDQAELIGFGVNQLKECFK